MTGDAVLSQIEYTYDDDGNVTFVVNRDRFHDETGTGALGTPGSGSMPASATRPRTTMPRTA